MEEETNGFEESFNFEIRVDNGSVWELHISKEEKNPVRVIESFCSLHNISGSDKRILYQNIEEAIQNQNISEKSRSERNDLENEDTKLKNNIKQMRESESERIFEYYEQKIKNDSEMFKNKTIKQKNNERVENWLSESLEEKIIKTESDKGKVIKENHIIKSVRFDLEESNTDEEKYKTNQKTMSIENKKEINLAKESNESNKKVKTSEESMKSKTPVLDLYRKSTIEAKMNVELPSLSIQKFEYGDNQTEREQFEQIINSLDFINPSVDSLQKNLLKTSFFDRKSSGSHQIKFPKQVIQKKNNEQIKNEKMNCQIGNSVEERLIQKGKEYKEKREIQAKEKLKKMMEKCTFEPNKNKKKIREKINYRKSLRKSNCGKSEDLQKEKLEEKKKRVERCSTSPNLRLKSPNHKKVAEVFEKLAKNGYGIKIRNSVKNESYFWNQQRKAQDSLSKSVFILLSVLKNNFDKES